eukprot:170200-Pyramimonas_sp.AAC.1
MLSRKHGANGGGRRRRTYSRTQVVDDSLSLGASSKGSYGYRSILVEVGVCHDVFGAFGHRPPARVTP